MLYITTATTKTIDRCAGLRITVNAALTGTITVTDAGAAIAVITNPTVGNQFEYFGFNGPITVTNSATGDITISILSANRT
jgi:hypothetical protein